MNLDLLKKIISYKNLFYALFILPQFAVTPYVYQFLVAFKYIPFKVENITPIDPLFWYIFPTLSGISIFLYWIIRWSIAKFRRVKQISLANGKPCRIAILLSCDDEIVAYRDKLYKKFEEHISLNGLKNIIICECIKEKDVLEKYTTREDASKYKKEFQETLVVIARLESGKRKGEVFYSIPYINLAFETPIMPNVQIFNSLKFQIQDSESLSDIRIVGQNLYFLSNIFLALTLFCSYKFELADKLVTDLYSQIRDLKSNKNYIKIYALTLDLLARTKNAIFSKEYEEFIKPNITKKSEKITRIVNNQIRIIDLYSAELVSFDGLNLKSILLFHLGEIKESKNILNSTKKTFEKNEKVQCCCNLSLAFLEMWRGMYKVAVRRYRTFKNISFEMAQSIIDFNEMVIKNNPERTDLLFIIAAMRKFEFSQCELSDWNKFISSNQKSENNKFLFEYANERIAYLSKAERENIILQLDKKQPFV